jgi:hypothetical protein
MLSPALAFVVQFRATAPGVREGFAGRVEHLTSGNAERFSSPDELLAYFARIPAAQAPARRRRSVGFKK